MTGPSGRCLSTSTWSLHRAVGRTFPDGPAQASTVGPTGGVGLPLVEVPARVRAAGIGTLEVCHFHLRRHDRTPARELKAAATEAGVELFSLLIDDGDLAHPTHGARDAAWVREWVDVAAEGGFRCARVIAGKQPTSPEAMDRAAAALADLARHAASVGVRLMTENWFDLLPTPAAVHALLDRLGGAVGLCCDFGNWKGATKYDDLAAILPGAESCHAKARFTGPAALDVADYRRCLDLTRAANFSGPYTLIYDGPDPDELAGLEAERQVVLPYLA